jgi:hypothetical protein
MCRRKGGAQTGPSPVDRGRSGSKHHLLVDATGIPLAWTVTGGNRNDVTQLVPLVERIPPVRGRVGRPRRRPERVTADRGYDHDKYHRRLRRRGIGSEIARRKTGHGGEQDQRDQPGLQGQQRGGDAEDADGGAEQAEEPVDELHRSGRAWPPREARSSRSWKAGAS